MAGAKSLPPLHATVSANASPYIKELVRAEAATKTHARSIGAGVDKMIHEVNKSFTLTKLGKGILQGIGFGSGFAIAQTVGDKITQHYRDQADIAKGIEESTARQLATTREIIELRQSDEQKRLALEKQIADVNQQLSHEQRQRFDMVYKGGAGFDAFELVEANEDWAKAGAGRRAIPRERTKEEQEEVNRLFEEQKKLGLALDRFKGTEQIVAVRNALTDFFSEMDAVGRVPEALDKFFKPLDQLSEQLYNRLDVAADRLKDRIATPTDKLNEAVNEIADLYSRGKISFEQAGTAWMLAQRDFGRATDPRSTETFRRWEQAAGEVKADDMTRRGMGTGANYSEINKQTNSILAEIAQLIRQGLMRGAGNQFSG